MQTSQSGGQAEDGLWLTTTELAAHKGVSKQAVSERVARLEAAGQIATRPGKGRAKLINVAAYDRAVSQTADLARTTGAATKRGHAAAESGSEPEADPAAASASAVYTREQARHMAYKADMAQLELEERRGRLVRVDKVNASAREAGVMIVQALDGFLHLSDDLAAAAGRGGARGVREVLKKGIYEARLRIANALDAKATVSPEADASAAEEPLADPADLPSIRDTIMADGGPVGHPTTPQARTTAA